MRMSGAVRLYYTLYYRLRRYSFGDFLFTILVTYILSALSVLYLNIIMKTVSIAVKDETFITEWHDTTQLADERKPNDV